MLPSQRPVSFVALFAALGLSAVAGCDSGSRPSVSGQVKYDGKVVDQGGVAFIPLETEGGGMRSTGDIRDGHYELDSHRGPPPGKYRVQLYWRKKTGNKVPGEGGHPKDEIVPGIPEKYNTETELIREVKPGHNTFDFDLKP